MSFWALEQSPRQPALFDAASDRAVGYGELIRTRNLDRSLKRVYRLDARKLEARFFEALR